VTINSLKDIPEVECLHEEQKDCIKHMVNGRCLCKPCHQFWKELNFSTLSITNVLNERMSWRRLHDHGGLSSSRSHNERPTEQLKRVGAAATVASGTVHGQLHYQAETKDLI